MMTMHVYQGLKGIGLCIGRDLSEYSEEKGANDNKCIGKQISLKYFAYQVKYLGHGHSMRITMNRNTLDYKVTGAE